MSPVSSYNRGGSSVRIIAMVAIVVLCLLLGRIVLKRLASESNLELTSTHVGTGEIGLPSTNTPVSDKAKSKGRSAGASHPSYKRAFAAATNYWDFAHAILPAAKRGDADAAWYLSKVLGKCAEDDKMYFMRGGKVLSLDEALQFALQRHMDVATPQVVYERCHQFLDSASDELGNSKQWLVAASAAGQPVAQATLAVESLMDLRLHMLADAGGVPSVTTTSTDDDSDPRALLRSAVESKDPEVLFAIGEAQEMLRPQNGDASTDTWAWWLLACQRGLDCTVNAEWVKEACFSDPQCESFSGPTDLVRNVSGDKWPTVQQRAREIDAQLNSGQWANLGLGSD